MQIRVFNIFDQELERLWVSLEEEAFVYPFQTYTWLLHWYRTVGAPLHRVELSIVVILNEHEIQLLLPLGIRKYYGVRFLEWLGGIHADYMSPIIHKHWKSQEKDFMDLWSQIDQALPHYDVRHFVKQPEMIGNEKNPFISLLKNTPYLHSYSTILINDWQIFKEKYAEKKVILDSERQRRRLLKKGSLIFIVADKPSEFKEITNVMIHQKLHRYANDVNNILSLPEHKRFYLELNTTLSKSGQIHCSALKLDDIIIATHWGVLHNGRFFYLMPAFESREWARYSPGRLLLEYLMEWACDHSVKVFDFNCGYAPYKEQWSNSIMKMHEHLEGVSLKGKIFVVAKGGKQFLRTLIKTVKIYIK